jgi:hypothetical protein
VILAKALLAAESCVPELSTDLALMIFVRVIGVASTTAPTATTAETSMISCCHGRQYHTMFVAAIVSTRSNIC